MMKNIKVRSYAKLNLFLEITGKRDDGYHLLKTVMQSVSLCDTLEFSVEEGAGVEIKSNVKELPVDKSNLIWKAADAFFDYVDEINRQKITVNLNKRIPAMAGMAGGSSNAAATLVALNELYYRPLSQPELCKIGEKIGADIPFCIMGGTALCQGVGDIMSMLPSLKNCCFVVIKPDVSVSTPEAYKKFDSIDILQKPDYESFYEGLKTANIDLMAVSMYNSLEFACGLKEVDKIKQRLIQHGALNAMMTGSGSAVFGVYEDICEAEKALREFDDYSFKGVFQPCNKGVEIIK